MRQDSPKDTNRERGKTILIKGASRSGSRPLHPRNSDRYQSPSGTLTSPSWAIPTMLGVLDQCLDAKDAITASGLYTSTSPSWRLRAREGSSLERGVVASAKLSNAQALGPARIEGEFGQIRERGTSDELSAEMRRTRTALEDLLKRSIADQISGRGRSLE